MKALKGVICLIPLMASHEAIRAKVVAMRSGVVMMA